VPIPNESEIVDGAPPASESLVIGPKFEAASDNSSVLELFIVPCWGRTAEGMPRGAVNIGVTGPSTSFDVSIAILPWKTKGNH
jgi:hypothetical protein